MYKRQRLSTGVLAAFFAFPQLGRPHFPEAGNGSDPVMVLGHDRVTVQVVGLPSESAELIRAALADRIALVASGDPTTVIPVSYTHLRAHETVLDLVCRLLL